MIVTYIDITGSEMWSAENSLK